MKLAPIPYESETINMLIELVHKFRSIINKNGGIKGIDLSKSHFTEAYLLKSLMFLKIADYENLIYLNFSSC